MGVKRVRGWFGAAKDDEETTMECVLDVIESMTGAVVEPDWMLAECGLSSVAGPVLIAMLTDAFPGISISAADIIAIDTVEQLVEVIEQRLAEAKKTGVV